MQFPPRRTPCWLLFSILLPLALLQAGTVAARQPQPVQLIFDTDIGNDVDDAMALSVIHALASRGECNLLAVTVTKDNPYAAPCVDLLNTFYGRGDIPIGAVRKGMAPEDGRYIRQLATAMDNGKPRYPHRLRSGTDAPEAVRLLRKTLASQPDGSIVMVQVGFSTNLSRLLDSPPDNLSPLDGRHLVQQKVKLLSIMAGAFSPDLARKHYREYNVVIDIPTARKLVQQWPTAVVFSGFEIGETIQYPGRSIQDDYRYVSHHPMAEAYDLYRGKKNDQPTFDLTSVLYAVRPDRGYFQLSPPGRATVDSDGFAHFQQEPNGPHRYLQLTPDQVVQVREALVMLCSQPPAR